MDPKIEGLEDVIKEVFFLHYHKPTKVVHSPQCLSDFHFAIATVACLSFRISRIVNITNFITNDVQLYSTTECSVHVNLKVVRFKIP